mmetsp:Transcript_7968/g.24482  ORF Transcript_7968/g.24482 Transcript_7968/m.24482 type:complete len:200 (-) Transcript_7968:790-1389(-)
MPRHEGAGVVLGDELLRGKQARKGARGRDGRPDHHIGRAEVVEQPRRVVLLLAVGYHHDVEDSPRDVKGLLEGQVAQDAAKLAAQLLGAVHGALGDQVAQRDLVKGHEAAAVLAKDHLGLIVQKVLADEVLVLARAHRGGHDSTAAGAGDDARQQAVLHQRLHHAHMEDGHGAAAREQQRRAAVSVARLHHKRQALGQR